MEKIVLVGNPNVGKSVFFNSLTGVYAEVSNFPGTTVDLKTGKFGKYEVVDTPGIYGVSCFNDEERVARQVIIDGDIIVNVVDALHLGRDLFLTQQLIDMGKRIIVCLNMMDEIEENALSLDVAKLSDLLGVPVIPTVAKTGKNVEQLKDRIEEAWGGNPTADIEEQLDRYNIKVRSKAEKLLLLEDDELLLKQYHLEALHQRDHVYFMRRKHVDQIVSQVFASTQDDRSIATRVGRVLLSPKTGIPAMLATLLLIFLFLGYVIAQVVVGFTEETIMQGYYEPFIRWAVSHVVNESSVLGQFLVGEFGLLTMVPTYIFGLLLPLVAGFYLMLSILEDTGYLPRIATLLDRGLSKIGLNGRAIIPFILGFGCVTVATVSTRLLGSRRERTIATALLGLTIPCSAQFGIIIGNVSKMGVGYSFVYAGIIVLVFVLAGKVLDKALPGRSSDLLIDLPRMRVPQPMNVLKKTYLKTQQFLKEAIPIFALGALIITTLEVTKLLDRIIDFVSPLIVGFLHLPREATTAFIMGIIRRDFGAAGLDALPMTNQQILVSMVTLTLFVPCLASVLMIFKERTKTEAAAIWIGSLVIAFLVGGALANVMLLF